MTQNTSPSSPDLTISWHALSAEEVLKELKTNLPSGLTSQEAGQRLERFGPNQLTEKPPTSFFALVLDQLKNFIVILLIVAAVVSLLLGETVDALAIFVIVVLNAVLGVVQESRAQQALAALKKMAGPEALVLRNGSRQVIPAAQLVPGDIVFLEAGNFTPADIRLLEAVNLRVEEAALTGESLPVQKNAALRLEKDVPLGDRKNTVFMGTLVNYGRGQGVVIATGMHTQLGLIATMLASVEDEETPLQKRLDELGRALGIGALAVCGLIFLVGFLRAVNEIGFSTLFQPGVGLDKLVELFMIAVSLAIAAVPEGLPAVVTISLALGMREMIRRHALIRKLSSVETLGSTTVICTDKTGTLTQNEMTVTRIWVDGRMLGVTGLGYNPEGTFELEGKSVDIRQYPGVATTLWVSVLNNDAHLEELGGEDGSRSVRMIGDPTEGALLVAAAKSGAVLPHLKDAYPRQSEIPFDSGLKRMVTVHEIENPSSEDLSPFTDNSHKDGFAIAVKGAPDVVLELCDFYQTIDDKVQPLDEPMRQRILQANDKLTGQALRVLGLAYRTVPSLPVDFDHASLEQDLVFAGMVGMIDPPRETVKPALVQARKAGIRTIMITGDYPNTARAIGEQIGLLMPGHGVMTGVEINDLDDAGLSKAVKVTDIFARVAPEHKMRIVDALRSDGEVTAMTGDGVNDAPAIKRADIGIAMGITGTDVAKETADMVLTDDNYASIVSAIEQGRIIYGNIRKFVSYLLSCNIAEIAIIFIGTIAGWGSPLAAIQLLWLNLVTDGAPALALATEKGDTDIMDRPPRPPSEPIINRLMLINIVVQMIAKTAVTLLAFYIGRFTDPQHFEFADTMAFVTLSCSELLRAITARSEYYPILKLGLFGNKWMNIAVASSFVLILAIIYIPGINVVFKTLPLGWIQWAEIIPLIFIPAIAAEMTKLVVRRVRV